MKSARHIHNIISAIKQHPSDAIAKSGEDDMSKDVVLKRDFWFNTTLMPNEYIRSMTGADPKFGTTQNGKYLFNEKQIDYHDYMAELEKAKIQNAVRGDKLLDFFTKIQHRFSQDDRDMHLAHK